MALGNQVLHRLKRGILLFEEHAAFPGLATSRLITTSGMAMD
jgi:predicted methyltransferase